MHCDRLMSFLTPVQQLAACPSCPWGELKGGASAISGCHGCAGRRSVRWRLSQMAKIDFNYLQFLYYIYILFFF